MSNHCCLKLTRNDEDQWSFENLEIEDSLRNIYEQVKSKIDNGSIFEFFIKEEDIVVVFFPDEYLRSGYKDGIRMGISLTQYDDVLGKLFGKK